MLRLRACRPAVASLLLIAAVLTGCPGESASPPNPPVLALSASSVSFASTTAGAAAPGAQSVTVSNVGGGTLGGITVGVAYSGGVTGWLQVDQTGAGPWTLSLQPLSSALPPGTHAATIEISAAGAAPKTLAVDFAVVADAVNAVMAADAARLRFDVNLGDVAPPAQDVILSNAGVGTLGTIGVSSDQAWLGATLSGDVVTVQVSHAGLAAGSYTGQVSVSSSAINSPLAIPIELVVGRPAIALSPAGAAFSTVAGTNPARQTFAVSNSGTGTLARPSVSSSAGWLSGAVSGASAPYTVTVAVDVTGLPPGTYAAQLTVASALASNSPRSFLVSLVVDPSHVTRTSATAGGGAALLYDAAISKMAACQKAGGTWTSLVGPEIDALAGEIQASVDAGRMTYDSAALGSCLAAIAGATCVQMEADPTTGALAACDTVFTGAVANGAACARSDECATGWCNDATSSTCPYLCTAKKDLGVACTGDEECTSNACGGGKCVANVAGAIDQPCGAGSPQCQPGLYCQWQSTPPYASLCEARGAAGATCTDSDECLTGLGCADDGFCRPLVGAGASCAPGAGACGLFLYCSAAAGSRCADWPYQSGDSCAETRVCAGDLYCGAAKTCVAGTVPPGGTCGGGYPATEPFCTAGTYCSSGVSGNLCRPEGGSPPCP
jgi:hypothetical protein